MVQDHHERAHEFNGRIDEIRNMAIARRAPKSLMDTWKHEMYATFAGTGVKRQQYLDADIVFYRLLGMLKAMKEDLNEHELVTYGGELLDEFKVKYFVDKIHQYNPGLIQHSLARVSLRAPPMPIVQSPTNEEIQRTNRLIDMIGRVEQRAREVGLDDGMILDWAENVKRTFLMDNGRLPSVYLKDLESWETLETILNTLISKLRTDYTLVLDPHAISATFKKIYTADGLVDEIATAHPDLFSPHPYISVKEHSRHEDDFRQTISRIEQKARSQGEGATPRRREMLEEGAAQWHQEMLAAIIHADKWNYLGREKAWKIIKAFLVDVETKLSGQQPLTATDGTFQLSYTVKALLEKLHKELPSLVSSSLHSHRQHSLGPSRRISGRCAQLMRVQVGGLAKEGGYHFAGF